MPRRNPLSLELLETFLTLVDCEGDASLAATRLKINQPSISKRLKSLQYTGDPLQHPWVERQGKTWTLTTEGERILPAVRELIKRHQQLTRFVTSGSQESVHIVCGQSSNTTFMRAAVVEFHRRQPETLLRISTRRSSERIEMVAIGNADFALVSHSKQEVQQIARRQLHVEDFSEVPLVLCCSDKSEWAKKFRKLIRKKVTPQMARQFPLILPEPDSVLRMQLDTWLESGLEESQEIQVILETGGWPSIREYIRAGMGVGLLPSVYAQGYEDLIISQLENESLPQAVNRLVCRYSSASEKTLDLTNQAREFWDCLQEQKKQLR